MLNRRQILQGGLAAGLVAGLARPAAAFDPFVRKPAQPFAGLGARSLAQPPAASAPVSTALNPRLLARAKAALEQHRSSLDRTDVIAIADFSRPSRDPRFHLVDMRTGEVQSHRVCHGRGSDPDHSGWVERFSNEMGSYATSNGAYVTGDFYPGKYGRSMRLRGLDYANSNAEARAIVVHSAWYAEPDVLAEHGKLGRSEGCFAMSESSLHQVLARLGPGRLLYADKIA
jgi:hypothetical protein